MSWKLSAAEKKEIVQLYRGGMNTTQLAEKFSVGAETVAGVLRRRDIPRRPRGTRKAWTEAEEMEIVRLYLAGLSVRELAEKFNIGRGFVDKVLARHATPKRPPGTYPRKFSDL